ncbi:MAG: hypothetical protein LC745_13515, partial [Planctomycetia bacterium]|nr:hypothetical protein [Planctomycetia bacterium]
MPHGCPAALLLTLALLAPIGSPAAAEDDDPDSLLPGVVARFQAEKAPGVGALRISPTLSWD